VRLGCDRPIFCRIPLLSRTEWFSRTHRPAKIVDFTATYGTNVMTCVFFDFIIPTLVMIFLAGFCHLIRQANEQHEWLGTLVFGVGLVYVTLTFIADSMQAATVVDARTMLAIHT